jgi:SAM-dependent methyltransferase
MPSVEQLANGLQLDPDGCWSTPTASDVSYPAEGNDFCMSVEEQSFWFSHRNKAILAAVARFPPAGGGPLLDVGAGNGFVAEALGRAGVRAVAIEPNAAGARNAVARGLSPVIRGVLPDPSFHEKCAGGIALFDVLEHVADDRGFLTSLAPYLGSGGRMYITTPSHMWLWSGDDVSSGHHRRYTIRTLRAVLEDAGYDVEYATYLFWWLPLPLLLFRRIPWLLRGDRAKKEAPSAAEHTVGGSMVRRLVQATFALETMFIKRARSVPIGASCLVVAQPRTTQPPPASAPRLSSAACPSPSG